MALALALDHVLRSRKTYLGRAPWAKDNNICSTMTRVSGHSTMLRTYSSARPLRLTTAASINGSSRLSSSTPTPILRPSLRSSTRNHSFIGMPRRGPLLSIPVSTPRWSTNMKSQPSKRSQNIKCWTLLSSKSCWRLCSSSFTCEASRSIVGLFLWTTSQRTKS
jgi:hypothetical protein